MENRNSRSDPVNTLARPRLGAIQVITEDFGFLPILPEALFKGFPILLVGVNPLVTGSV